MTAPRFELTSQRQKVSRLPTEPPGRPDITGEALCILVDPWTTFIQYTFRDNTLQFLPHYFHHNYFTCINSLVEGLYLVKCIPPTVLVNLILPSPYLRHNTVQIKNHINIVGNFLSVEKLESPNLWFFQEGWKLLILRPCLSRRSKMGKIL